MPSYTNVSYGGAYSSIASIDINFALLVAFLCLGVFVGIALYQAVYLKARRSLKLIANAGVLVLFGFLVEYIASIMYWVIELATATASSYSIEELLGGLFYLGYHLFYGFLAYWLLKQLYFRMESAGDLDFLKEPALTPMETKKQGSV